MKKYKLIKAYPGSPKLGFIVTVSNDSVKNFCWFEKYIFENKPCLSYKDIIVLLNLGNYEDFELRSFIKRKLNS